MNKLIKPIFYLATTFFLMAGGSLGDDGVKDAKPTLTHADAAFILAKYSGFFDRYVDADADLSECVAFLNKTGIYFGLLEVVNGSEFTMNDAARSLGQIELVLTGEAEFSGGKVERPKGVDSWEEFCTMNRVEYVGAYHAMVELLHMAYKTGE